MKKTVSFSRSAANLFFHILTRCNLSCRHCYINPEQHGRRTLSLDTIIAWLTEFRKHCQKANVVFLGGEPTLHPELPAAVARARQLGFSSVTIDTNGYLFHDILERVSPGDVDFFSFSLDGATPATNDPIRGAGSFTRCTEGLRRARAAGFQTSLIFTVSRLNIDELERMVALVVDLKIERLFIQVIGLRGQSARPGGDDTHRERLQIGRHQWQQSIPLAAARAARHGLTVVYPKVYLDPDEPFECAGRVADNYFVFPNGRVYRCPLCEDHPLHSFELRDNRLVRRRTITESNLFELTIPEGCVMNKLVQPGNIAYDASGRPLDRIACCLLKEEITA
jgi:MoaA/NifB/PqqE/SkfB family radical SAM enzyme